MKIPIMILTKARACLGRAKDWETCQINDGV